MLFPASSWKSNGKRRLFNLNSAPNIPKETKSKSRNINKTNSHYFGICKFIFISVFLQTLDHVFSSFNSSQVKIQTHHNFSTASVIKINIYINNNTILYILFCPLLETVSFIENLYIVLSCPI